MVSENVEIAEVQAQRAWRNQESIQYGVNSDKRGGVRQAGTEIRGESFATDRNDWQRGDFTEQCGQAILGGIIDRLISKTLDLIEESENRTAELKKHVEELKELSTQFQEKTENKE
ncbi:hypothetical protein QI031_16695 [Halotia branconii CENA392]|uniref:Uncharacterized protein n=1 Tax=Halotia branconii CENA392 TaxID=1539056 RepID=A0AAJ6NNF7_9CYAN|nr:hypothetical protein [Halotia branconii]WGV23463.1 hypothetical protein QI031_16695 [Halotia branconii CENA392]